MMKTATDCRDFPRVNYALIDLFKKEQITKQDHATSQPIPRSDNCYEGVVRSRARYENLLATARREVAAPGVGVAPPVVPRLDLTTATKNAVSQWQASKWGPGLIEYERSARGTEGAGQGTSRLLLPPNSLADTSAQLSLPCLTSQTARATFHREKNNLTKFLEAEVRDRTMLSLPRKPSIASSRGWHLGEFYRKTSAKLSPRTERTSFKRSPKV